jgi:hypothetical protein
MLPKLLRLLNGTILHRGKTMQDLTQGILLSMDGKIGIVRVTTNFLQCAQHRADWLIQLIGFDPVADSPS